MRFNTELKRSAYFSITSRRLDRGIGKGGALSKGCVNFVCQEHHI